MDDFGDGFWAAIALMVIILLTSMATRSCVHQSVKDDCLQYGLTKMEGGTIIKCDPAVKAKEYGE